MAIRFLQATPLQALASSTDTTCDLFDGNLVQDMPGWRTPSPNAALELQVCHLCTLCSRWRLLAIRNVPHPREKTRIERNRYAVHCSAHKPFLNHLYLLSFLRTMMILVEYILKHSKQIVSYVSCWFWRSERNAIQNELDPKRKWRYCSIPKKKQHLVNDSIRIVVPSTNDSRCRGWHARFTCHCQSVTYEYIVQEDVKAPKPRHVHWDCISYGSSAHTNSKMWYRVACVGGSHLFTITSPSLSRSASLDPLLKILWVFRIESEG